MKRKQDKLVEIQKTEPKQQEHYEYRTENQRKQAMI